MIRDIIHVGGCRLLPAEAAVLRFLRRRRLYVPADNAWGSFRVLRGLALMGLAVQCGRIFYALPAGDRLAALLPPTNADLFGGVA